MISIPITAKPSQQPTFLLPSWQDKATRKDAKGLLIVNSVRAIAILLHFHPKASETKCKIGFFMCFQNVVISRERERERDMSRPFTLLAALLLLASQATASAEDNVLARSFQFTNGELVRLPEVDRSNNWIIRGQCDSCDDGSCTSCANNFGIGSCCGTWSAGGEIVFLKDHGNYGGTADDSEAGYRLFVGYERNDGLGVTVRYFDYDNGDDADYGNDLMSLDLELTTNLEICNTQIMLSGGYRHAEVNLMDGYAIWNDLNGITFGIRAQRQIWCNLSAFAWLQDSFLFGNDDGNHHPTSHINWTQAQLGLQYDGCFGGRNAWVRAGVEAHNLNASYDSYYYNSPGAFGYFVGAGLSF